MSTPTIDLDKLERMAKAATPGKWTWRQVGSFSTPGCAIFWPDTSKGGVHYRRLDSGGGMLEADANFIAAANPPAVLELVRRLREAESRPTQAAQDVLAERQRQVEAEGWTPDHDDEHAGGQMARAASIYASNAAFATALVDGNTAMCSEAPLGWPWAKHWWKPVNSRRDLVKAAALILAEIERLDRAEAKKQEAKSGD